MSADVPLPPLGSIGPWGVGGGGIKNSKNGGGLIRAVDSYHFCLLKRYQMWSDMYGTHLHTFWCGTVKIVQGVSTGWAKKVENLNSFPVF